MPAVIESQMFPDLVRDDACAAASVLEFIRSLPKQYDTVMCVVAVVVALMMMMKMVMVVMVV